MSINEQMTTKQQHKDSYETKQTQRRINGDGEVFAEHGAREHDC